MDLLLAILWTKIIFLMLITYSYVILIKKIVVAIFIQGYYYREENLKNLFVEYKIYFVKINFTEINFTLRK